MNTGCLFPLQRLSGPCWMTLMCCLFPVYRLTPSAAVTSRLKLTWRKCSALTPCRGQSLVSFSLATQRDSRRQQCVLVCLCLQAVQTVPEDQRRAVHRGLQRCDRGGGRTREKLLGQQTQLLHRTRHRYERPVQNPKYFNDDRTRKIFNFSFFVY